MEKGFPTHTTDITGKTIKLGDVVGYDFDDNTSFFEVVFEENAFRKKYKIWNNGQTKPILECGQMAIIMRLKIVSLGILWIYAEDTL